MTHRLKLFLINLNLFNLSQILTLFFIIIHFQKIVKSSPILAIPVLIFASIGLIFQESRQSKILWLGLSALFASYIILHWQLIDNHIYLWGYWTLANFLCLLTKNQYLASNKCKSLIFRACFLQFSKNKSSISIIRLLLLHSYYRQSVLFYWSFN